MLRSSAADSRLYPARLPYTTPPPPRPAFRMLERHGRWSAFIGHTLGSKALGWVARRKVRKQECAFSITPSHNFEEDAFRSPRSRRNQLRLTRAGCDNPIRLRDQWRNQMFRLLGSAMVLTVAVVGNALAVSVAVPAPEIGGGMVGTMVAAGVVYLINRRRSRS